MSSQTQCCLSLCEALSSLLLIPHRSMLSTCLWIPSCFSLVLSFYSSFSPFIFYFGRQSPSYLCHFSVFQSYIQREKIWMYVFVLRVESKVRLPVIVSTNKQHQEAVMSALSPTLSHRRSHCPSFCMISQCCICQWRNRKREENRFPSSFHRWLACSEWDQEKERRGLWLMRHRLAGPHLSGFGSGREREIKVWVTFSALHTQISGKFLEFSVCCWARQEQAAAEAEENAD